MEHETFQQWLDLAADGVLPAADRAALDQHLEACAECRAEAGRLAAVVRRLEESRIEVRSGFTREVMAALEPAPWEARTRRAWRWPFALLLALGSAAAALYGGAAATLDPSGRSWAALGALADLFRAALVAGAGLAAATWSGIGAAVGEWLGRSPANWLAAGVLVACLNLLAIRLARRRAGATASPAGRPRSGPPA
jgi:anti-sigma factor RsiW